MGKQFSIKSRRMGVLNMYISAIVFFTLFLIGEYSHWNGLLISGALVFLVNAVTSFYLSIVKPGIWRLYRAKSHKLDEREKGVILDSVRHSYNIFGVIAPLLLFGTVLSVRYNWLVLTHRGHYALGLILCLFFNFLVAVIPPSVIAWKENIIED